MVMSMAIPSATLKMSTVEGFSGTPVQPMMPAVTMSGMTLGISEQNKMRNERNRYNMHNAMSPKAQSMLSFSPLMMKRVPSKNVTEPPVSSTLALRLPQSESSLCSA